MLDPHTPRAVEALARLPAWIDTPLLFPAPLGGYIGLDVYGHLAHDSEQAVRARLAARSGRAGVEVASDDAGE